MTPGSERPLGLGREKRLNKTDEFSSVFRFRRVLRGECLDLHYRPNGLPHARLGMTVSRRVARSAVARNFYRRLLRESFRLRQPELGALDIVVRLKSACPKDRFKDEFARLLDACRQWENARPAAPVPETRSWIHNAS